MNPHIVLKAPPVAFRIADVRDERSVSQFGLKADMRRWGTRS